MSNLSTYSLSATYADIHLATYEPDAEPDSDSIVDVDGVENGPDATTAPSNEPAPSARPATTAGALQQEHRDAIEAGVPRNERKITEEEAANALIWLKKVSPVREFETPLEELAALRKRVIMRYGRYFRGLEPLDGELHYGRERDMSELSEWLRTYGPLLDPLMTLFMTAQDGTGVRKTNPELLDQYSTLLAGGVVMDLTISESFYNSSSGNFHEAAAPLANLVPEFNQDIHTWLTLLGREHAHTVLSWVASATLLTRPCASLFVVGDSGSGKSMLAEGLAKLWSIGAATTLDALTDSAFNGAISRCPFVVGDEEFPEKFKSTKLRRWTASSVQDVNKKFKERSPLYGALRFYFAANREHALHFTDQLGAADLKAVGLRFIYIDVDEKPAAFLRRLGGRATTDAWVAGGGIARHALWLRDNYRFVPGQRLIVEGGEIGKSHRALVMAGAVAEQVCTGLARLASAPEQYGQLVANGTLIIGDGEILVNGPCLHEAWRTIFPGGERVAPLLDAVNQALSNFSLQIDQPRRKARDGKTRRYWPIDPKIVVDFAERAQLGDLDVIRQNIEGPSRAAAAKRPFAHVGEAKVRN